MVVYVEGGKTQADYWDDEGRVIRHDVAFAPRASKAVFSSDEVAGAPRFRLTYE